MPKEKFTCTECGIEIWRYRCTLKDDTRPFCSKACVGKAKRHGSTLFCAWCDSPFYRRFGEQDREVRQRQFCSKECYQFWRDSKRTSYPKDGGRHKHRIVAESVLGRALTVDEVVHHFDENKQNYRPENLAVFPTQAIHARCHFSKNEGKRLTAAELRFFSLVETAKREASRTGS